MYGKRLLAVRILLLLRRRVLALILLALLTMVSVPALSGQRMAGTKQPVTRASAHTSQATKAKDLAIQGRELYEAGQFDSASVVWHSASVAYAQAGDKNGRTKSLVNAASALQALGHYPRACNTLLQAFDITGVSCQRLTSEMEFHQPQNSWLKTLSAQPNSLTKAIGLRSLGNILQKLDDLELSQQVLQLSLSVAKAIRSPKEESAAWLSLGNVEQARGNRARSRQNPVREGAPTPWRCLYRPSNGAPKKFYQQAAEFYQQSAAASISIAPNIWIEAQVNRLSALLETNSLSSAQSLWPQIQSQLKNLPANRQTVYAQINFAQSLKCLQVASTKDKPPWTEIAQTLAQAAVQARSEGDQRAESYALGYLGGLYAQTQQWSNATDLTQQALLLAQAIKASDITYLWQWQLGHLLGIQRDTEGAIALYTAAVNSLQSIRSDLVANTNVEFVFRESVEPVYRQLVNLLLQPDHISQKNLLQARSVIEALQLVELENLLGCNLQAGLSEQIDSSPDAQTAVIYPIVLDDRIEVILSLYRQPLRHYSKSLPKGQNIERLSWALQASVQEPDSLEQDFLKISQQVYSFLLEPLAADLEKSGAKTLVFVLDGPLRNIPMAALHNGQHYVAEKYAVALSPSLQLLQPKHSSGNRLEILAAGISQKIPGFSGPALPEVKDELDRISQVSKSKVIRNQEFTSSALESQINAHPFSVVHLATHGQFSSKPDQTYIRTWDERININDLKSLLQTREQSQPDAIELLVLSACQTAEGDKRAALGLAGIAVRAGARSTLATLWEVNDTSTAELMAKFYRTLSNPGDPQVTKTKALQSAQLELLHRYKSPYYWAAYVLVGNWL